MELISKRTDELIDPSAVESYFTVGKQLDENQRDICRDGELTPNAHAKCGPAKNDARPAARNQKEQIKATPASEKSLTVLDSQGSEVVLPENVYDVNGQQLDTRRENSWLLKLGEVETVEAAEVFAINALASANQIIASKYHFSIISNH